MDEKESTPSDQRIKYNVQALDIPELQEFIQDLDPIEFSYIGNPSREIGLIAQNVVEVIGQRKELKSLIKGIESYDPVFGDYPLLEINYTKFIPILIALLRDQERRIKQIEEELESHYFP